MNRVKPLRGKSPSKIPQDIICCVLLNLIVTAQGHASTIVHRGSVSQPEL